MSMNSGATELGEIDKPRVCVLFPGALGDFVCFLPALHELANASVVDLLARSEFAAIAPRGVRVHSLERPEVRRLFIDGGAADLRVIQFFSGYTAVYTWFASRQAVFVDQLQKATQGRAQIFPFRPDIFTLHQTDYFLTCLDSTASMTAEPLVELAADALLWCDNFDRRTEIGRAPFLIMAPGSGSQGKNWPEAHYLQVAQWWREQFGGKVVAVIGPVEAERHGFEYLSSCCQVASGLDLAQLAALIARCDVYVGNDSGVSHLAAAVGARTVAIFGPSNDRQWAPRGSRVSILRHQIACSPCGDTTIKLCPHHACLAELSPEEVIEELRKLPEIANLTRLGAGITV
jgi:ADP-heptose:LPS heptosyltransferase